MNVPRGIYWDVRLDLEPIDYEGECRECSLACEWIPWKIRAWQDLGGQSAAYSEFGEEGIEGTFYSGTHNPAVKLQLDVAAASGVDFAVEMRMDVALGYDAANLIVVTASGVVPFEGIWVAGVNFGLSNATKADALRLVAPFFEVDDLEVEDHGDTRFLLKPTSAGQK